MKLYVLLAAALYAADADAKPTFDPSAPFAVELGRGSGREGLDVIAIRNRGDVEVTRVVRTSHGPTRQKQTFTLDPAALLEIAASIERLHLAELNRRYDSGAWDGSQWVLRITQGPLRRVVYCSNLFPPELRTFAAELDAKVKAAPGKSHWQATDDHLERSLWDATPQK